MNRMPYGGFLIVAGWAIGLLISDALEGMADEVPASFVADDTSDAAERRCRVADPLRGILDTLRLPRSGR